MSLRMCNSQCTYTALGASTTAYITSVDKSLFALSAPVVVCVLMLMFCRLVLARRRLRDMQSALTAYSVSMKTMDVPV